MFELGLYSVDCSKSVLKLQSLSCFITDSLRIDYVSIAYFTYVETYLKFLQVTIGMPQNSG